jgi:transcriptional regulator with XRE-family HTH domain
MSKEKQLRNHSLKTLDAHARLAELNTPAKAACCHGEAMIGAQLRKLRKEQKLSIRSLAAKCGISANTLSLIENDHTSPSLYTLNLLSRGLEIPLVALFETEKLKPDLVYQQQGQRAQVHYAYGTLENLGEGISPLGAEPILVTLDAGQVEGKDISHAGREFIYCLEGKVTCLIANQEYDLAPGDSLLFDASVPHRWLNPHAVLARLLILFCPMEARDQPAERHLSH